MTTMKAQFDTERHHALLTKADTAVAHTNVNLRWHPEIHIAPRAGWMNDPNGVCYFAGRYHVFFQHHPYNAQWGPMHWGHVTSQDLVTWQRESVALAPSEDYDRDGVWSGSAVVTDDGELAVFYTGNRWHNGQDDTEGKYQYQCLATSDDGHTFTKHGIVIEPPAGVEDIRDPKVWREDGRWWMIVGVSAPVASNNTNRRGQVWLYSAENLTSWAFEQVLYEDPDPLCYMIECPDFFDIDGKRVLIYCPMTTAVKCGYGQRNGHNAGYAAGLWKPGEKFEVKHEFSQFDWGHHFYAPQTCAMPDGRRIMFGWLGGFELPLASQKEDNWSGHGALPRTVHIDDDYVLRTLPIAEITALRQTEKAYEVTNFTVDVDQTIQMLDYDGPQEIIVEVDLEKTTSEQVAVLVNQISETEYTEVSYDSLAQRVVLNRGKVGRTDRGYRAAPYDGQAALQLRIVVDRGSVEVFINDCEHTLSSLVFPRSGRRAISLAAVGGSIAVRRFVSYPLRSMWQ